MAHPQMFDDDDPYLARLRELALAFPDAIEAVAHGRPTFRVRKMFAVYGGTTKGDAATRREYPHGLLVIPEEEERSALEEDERAFVPAYMAPFGWVGLDLGQAPPDDVDWQEVAELLDGSRWRAGVWCSAWRRRAGRRGEGGTEPGLNRVPASSRRCSAVPRW